MPSLSYDRLDNSIIRLESSLGSSGASLAVGLLLLLAASIYVFPADDTVVLGNYYAELAEDPFAAYDDNPVAYRILTPLVSYVLGLRGELIIITNLLFAWTLLAVVYKYFREQTPRPGDAAIAATVIAFSLVTLTTIHYGGYTDSATYLLIFLMYRFRERMLLFYLLFLAALLNRESAVFLLPWFAFLRWHENQSARRSIIETVIGFGLMVAIYGLFREWLGSIRAAEYDLGYYVGPLLQYPFEWFSRSYPYQGLGLFTVFKLFWIIPVLAAAWLRKRDNRMPVISMALVIACATAQMFVAFDSSRMLTMAFPVMIISLLRMFAENIYDVRRWIGWLIVANLFVPQLYTAEDKIEVMESLPGELIRQMFTSESFRQFFTG